MLMIIVSSSRRSMSIVGIEVSPLGQAQDRADLATELVGGRCDARLELLGALGGLGRGGIDAPVGGVVRSSLIAAPALP
jgi:hypothetical protein